jgi:hypothetical protein
MDMISHSVGSYYHAFTHWKHFQPPFEHAKLHIFFLHVKVSLNKAIVDMQPSQNVWPFFSFSCAHFVGIQGDLSFYLI